MYTLEAWLKHKDIKCVMKEWIRVPGNLVFCLQQKYPKNGAEFGCLSWYQWWKISDLSPQILDFLDHTLCIIHSVKLLKALKTSLFWPLIIHER